MSRFGTMIISKDGVDLLTKGAFTIVTGGAIPTTMMGVDGKDHGSTEEHVPSSLDGTITVEDSTDIVGILNTNGATIQLELVGFTKNFVLSNARQTGDRSMDGKEGVLNVKFEGIGTWLDG